MSLDIRVNSIVYKLDEKFIITKLVDYENVLAKNASTGEVTRLKIIELSSQPIEQQKIVLDDLSLIPENKLEEAKNRFKAIEPVININSRRVIEQRAKEVGISPTTLYNWLRLYESTGRLSSLASLAVKGGKDKSRLSKEQEEIIDLVFKEYLLTKLQPTVQRVWEEIKIRCKRANIEAPSIASVRRRARKISEKELLKKREGKKAIEQFQMIQNEYPDGLYPMHVLQIDHTRGDVILVDDVYRLELGRPWITMAIDIYSRMVAGFYISFESPGYFGTGQALINAILPKNHLKEKYNLVSDYPICGIPKMVHLDNAAEFRGLDLQNVCEEYGIDIVWRPVGKARFGGHIERLLGTLTELIHTLDGTTSNKINRNRDYDAQKEAAMTLSEFEEWLTVRIADVYHKNIHSQINMTPLQKFDEGVFGSATQPPKGFAPRIENEEELRINLLPKEHRTIQKYGIQIENIYYYSEVLNAWIDSFDYIRGKKIKRKFLIRRDYRDISNIWFYDPTAKTYYKIPYRNISLPKVSIWEYRAAQKHLKSIENKEYDEVAVFEALERLRNLAKEAKNKTKTHRKIIDREEKRKANSKTVSLIYDDMKANPIPNYNLSSQGNKEESTKDNFDWFEGDIQPFEGIEESASKEKYTYEQNNNTNPMSSDDEDDDQPF